LTGDVDAAPPSRADGGTVLARGKALRPAARAPSAALTRAARGACAETRATAEGRSAGGSCSGPRRGGSWPRVRVPTLVARAGRAPLCVCAWMLSSLTVSAIHPTAHAPVDAEPSELIAAMMLTSWRSPIVKASLWLSTRGPTKESACEEIYRSRCARGKHNVRGDRGERQAARVSRGGDQRPSAGGATQDDPRQETCLSGGGGAERVAVRDPLAVRRGGCRRDGVRQPGSEGRPEGCLRSGGATAHGCDRAQGLQGGGRVQRATRAQPHPRDGRAGFGARAEPDQSPVPIARCRRRGHEHLCGKEPRAVAGEVARDNARCGQDAVRSVRCRGGDPSAGG